MRPPTLIIEADGTRHWGDPMAGAMVGHDMTGHAMGGMDPSMAGMDHGSHGMSAMLVAHAAAVLVSTALVIALRRLAAVAHRWLAAVLPEATSHLVLTPLVRPTTAPRRRTPRWALGAGTPSTSSWTSADCLMNPSVAAARPPHPLRPDAVERSPSSAVPAGAARAASSGVPCPRPHPPVPSRKSA